MTLLLKMEGVSLYQNVLLGTFGAVCHPCTVAVEGAKSKALICFNLSFQAEAVSFLPASDVSIAPVRFLCV